MPLADGSVRTFPRTRRERVVTTPAALHSLLPVLRNRMVHLTAFESIPIYKNITLKEVLFIYPFSASFLEEVVTEVLPLKFEKCQAVSMQWTASASASAATSHQSTEGTYSMSCTGVICLISEY